VNGRLQQVGTRDEIRELTIGPACDYQFLDRPLGPANNPNPDKGFRRYARHRGLVGPWVAV
jgi:hypothetical protein